MRQEAMDFCRSLTTENARRCHLACMDTLDQDMQIKVQHYSTHTMPKKLPVEEAKKRFLEAAERGCTPLEYMTKLKQLCHSIGISL